MSGQGDDRLGEALRGAVASGPKDVLALRAAVRDAAPGLLDRREGVLHAALHREVRMGTIVADGATPQGLPLYRLPTETPRSAFIPPVAAPKDAQRIASAVRDPQARTCIAANVAAHRAALDAAGIGVEFGSPKALRQLLRRVDRGRPTMVAPRGAWDLLHRFVVHEGPWIFAAVVAFFVIRHFLLEVYVIPSRSMMPTLEVGDRVVVTKIGGRDVPERWTILTFVRGGTTYVKRAVGLPGERISLHHGEVYVNGRLAAKPQDLCEALRSHARTVDLASEAFVDGADGWRRWTYVGPSLWANETAPGPRVPLQDVYLTLDVGRAEGGKVVLGLERAVGDSSAVRWELAVDDEGVRLRETGPAGRAPLLAEGKPVAAGRTKVRLSYVDGVLRAGVGGWSWSGEREAPPGAARFGVDLSGSAKALTLQVDRDIHYANMGKIAVERDESDRNPASHEHQIAEDSIFFLGDNTTDSRDSRYEEVGDIPLDVVVGPVRVRVWPPSRLGSVR